MNSDFVGRADDLGKLRAHLGALRRGRGRLLTVRGRRQAGKSRLVTEFVAHAGVPHLFTTGSRQLSTGEDLERFSQDAASCTLPGKDLLTSGVWSNWEQALRAVAAALPDGPAIVVFDELPWLIESDPGLEGTLQKLWDSAFEKRQVLFILIGSDLSVMEMLTEYGRPLYGRAKEMEVSPFDVHDTARMLGLDDGQAAEAFDAYLVTGGYPRLLAEWPRAGGLRRFVNSQLNDDNSDLAVVGQRILDAEFPPDSQAAQVLRVIGSGERGYRNIASQANIQTASLSRALAVLQTKRVVAVDQPTSIKPANEPRYRVADPYLRFWLRFIEPALPDVSRGRSDIAQERLWNGWEAYRGRAIEPIVREALTRLGVAGSGFVGGWWPRNNNPEVDLVGVDRPDKSRRVTFVGSIKWRQKEPFGPRDLDLLRAHQAVVPGGASAPLLVVSRSGAIVDEVECVTPDRLLEAWT